MYDLSDFEKWMREQKLARSTIAQRITDVKQVIRACTTGDEPPPARLHYAAKSFAAWCSARGLSTMELEPTLGLLLGREAKRTALTNLRTRKRPARAFALNDWRKLAAKIFETETREARVLELVLCSALRIGDVLRITREEVEHAVFDHHCIITVKGERERELTVNGRLHQAFAKLLDTWTSLGPDAPTIYDWISPDSKSVRQYSAAYQRCYRELMRLSDGLDVRGPVHAHRMRRTSAMQALSKTKDLVAIQQLLGHESLRTTMRYLDEERPDDVAHLRDELHETFLPEE